MEILIKENGRAFFAHKQWFKRGFYFSFENSFSGFFASSVYVVDDFGNLVKVQL